MKRALIVSVVLSLFIVSGVVLAQQSAPTATTPAPAAPAAAAPTPAAPAAAAPAPSAPATPAKPAAPAASLNIVRMEIAGSIADRQPAEIAASFPASQDKVYCYLELKDVKKDQMITYAWTFGQETDKVNQQVKQSARWRTWGSKSIAGRKGDWKVEMIDENGTVLKSATFKVE